MEKIQGIIVPLVTPLQSDGTLDETHFQKLLDHVIAGGVHAIFPLGTTGEGPALPEKLKRQVLAFCARAVAGRVPVFAGISAASGAESLEMGKFACSLPGITALVSALPCGLPADQREIINYYTMLAETLTKPIFIYNMPSLTGVSIAVETVLELAKLPNIAGYKDSSGDLYALERLVSGMKRDDFSLLVGPEHLTAPALMLGADGGVNGGANLEPELFVKLYGAVKSGKTKLADELQKRVVALQQIYGNPITSCSVVRGLKYQLFRRGLLQNVMAFPNLPNEE